MAVPKFEDFYRPILDVIANSSEGLTHKDIFRLVAERLSLTEEDQRVMTKGGTRPQFESHSRFVVFSLRKAGLLFSTERGKSQATDAGSRYLIDHNGPIQEVEIQRMISAREETSLVPASGADGLDVISPDDQMANSFQVLEEQLADEVLDNLKGISPTSFEHLSVALLSKMGYGIGEVTQRSHDGGVDGILSQDPLGLEKIYVQAKRWNTSQVPESEIRSFHTSLTAKGAMKGVLITNSIFAPKAQEVAKIFTARGTPISLIDGQELTRLMIQHGVGVVTEITYEVKKLDANYFSEI